MIWNVGQLIEELQRFDKNLEIEVSGKYPEDQDTAEIWHCTQWNNMVYLVTNRG